MLLPGFLYGPYREVMAASRRLVTQLRRGVPWNELPERLGGGMIDTREVLGLLVLNDSIPGEHFHLFAPAKAIDKAIPQRLPEDAYITLFESAIATRWGFLAMQGQWAMGFLLRPGHQQRLLHAALQWWDELMAEGPRWTYGSSYGKGLWEVPTNVGFCLGREGLPAERLDEPLPPGGLAELVAQTRAGLPPTRDQLH